VIDQEILIPDDFLGPVEKYRRRVSMAGLFRGGGKAGNYHTRIFQATGGGRGGIDTGGWSSATTAAWPRRAAHERGV